MKSSPIATALQQLGHGSPLLLEELGEAWRATRDETTSAYRQWCDAPIAQRRIAYTVYRAAADREAAAEFAFLKTMRVPGVIR